jgi:hypothetical protein
LALLIVLTSSVCSAQKQKRGKQSTGKSQQRSAGRNVPGNQGADSFERRIYTEGFAYDPEKWDDRPYTPAGVPSATPVLMDRAEYGMDGRMFRGTSMFLENQFEKQKDRDEEGELYQEPILAFDVLRRNDLENDQRLLRIPWNDN